METPRPPTVEGVWGVALFLERKLGGVSRKASGWVVEIKGSKPPFLQGFQGLEGQREASQVAHLPIPKTKAELLVPQAGA